jgi:hypothetical protein
MLKIQIQYMEMEDFTTRTLTFCHRKTHTFAQHSYEINIEGGESVLPGAALIGGNKNKKSALSIKVDLCFANRKLLEISDTF